MTTKATEAEGTRAVARWTLPAGLALLFLGIFLPWIKIRVPLQTVGYTAWDLPVLGWFATLWIVLIVGSVLVTRFSSSAAIAYVAAVVTIASAAIATFSALGVWRLPDRFPDRFIPISARPYAATLQSGPGLFCLALGCGLLGFWSTRQAVIQKEVRRHLEPEGWSGAAADDDVWGPSPW